MITLFEFLGVCTILANKWNPSIKNDAIIAGLLHDIGKSMNRLQLLRFCDEHQVTMYDFEIFDNLDSLHGKASSILFEEEFAPLLQQTKFPNEKLKKREMDRFHAISHAISCHVAGDTSMNLLDKIVFIADNIEPQKDHFILSKIKSGQINSSNQYIEEIIENKFKKSIAKARPYNPFLDSTLNTIREEER